MLARAEEEWAPADDPIFQLVPPSFQEIVVECYNNLGRPTVTFKSFWEVYCDLRDVVDATIPPSTITGLSQSISSEPGEDVEFTMADLASPELNVRNAVDIDERGDEEEGFLVSFTVDDDQDQLY